MSSREKVLELYRLDLRASEIAKKIGISRERVRQLVVKVNLELPVARRRRITEKRAMDRRLARQDQRQARNEWLFNGSIRGLSEDECWPWPLRPQSTGYGVKSIGRRGRKELAHR